MEQEDDFDRDLAGLTPDRRWHEWMARVEAVLFASDTVVPKKTLMAVIGQDASLKKLIGDINAALTHRPYEVVAVSGGWMMRTRKRYAPAIRKARHGDDKGVRLSEAELLVLATIAYQQPVSRADLKDVFGKDVNRDLLSRLQYRKLIANGPRSPRAGAPHTFVTTSEFLRTFDLDSLRDLPEMDFPQA
ncbi:SMC-Scp complex subunit ScpB [Neptunicoccus cionae]|uniref:Transcriptional regulator n=1 Tax=Neptunicoccus cionae TaxID=2035344 RepID=A0A916VS19_9RHOB|nr:SMC-Scp complex subunit ScpB [Amylibacter cionae]GGA27049.1 transcriptional regulator [Amylibacter cionae]